MSKKIFKRTHSFERVERKILSLPLCFGLKKLSLLFVYRILITGDLLCFVPQPKRRERIMMLSKNDAVYS